MRRLIVVAGFCLLVAGCGTKAIQGVRPAPVSKFKVLQAQLTPEDEKNIAKHCPFGMPSAEPGFEHGKTQFATRNGYALQHSSVDKIPKWVCESVDVADLTGNLPRPDDFRPDTKLPSTERSELVDYKGSGFDRGHLAPAGNQTVSKPRKSETFFLSNMAPQVGKKFNQSIWANLEDLTRSWVADEQLTEARMITGVFFYDPEEDDESTADGFIDFEMIGPNHVAVPTHFFKIVVGRFKDGTTNAIAFMMVNAPHNPPFQFSKHIVSIDFLEEKTGFNYLPDLDPLEEQRLERKPSPMWFQ